MLPTGSKPIFDARKAGKRPADLVLVSTVGRLPGENNPVVLADGDDWRFVEGLRICVMARQGVAFRQHLLAIAFCGPAWLGLWDVDHREGCDVIAHLRLDRLDARRFTADDFTTIFWPWSPWQNRFFEGTDATH